MSKTISIPTEEEINAIPSENWTAWLKAEYNHDCGEPDYISITTEKEEMDEEYQDNEYMISFKTFCSGLNQTYCDVTPEQHEKIKSGFYNDQLDNSKSDCLKILDFMGYKPKYKHEDGFYVNEKMDVITIDSHNPKYDFRPDLNWDDLNKVIDYIESRPSTLMTSIQYLDNDKSIQYLDNDKHTYSFKVTLQDGVTTDGLAPGASNESKIDAAYKGVMRYINWRNEMSDGEN